MKKLVVTLVLVGVFCVSGMGDALLNSMGYLAAGTINAHTSIAAASPQEDWTEKLSSIFDPAWIEKLQKADLVSLLKATSGNPDK